MSEPSTARLRTHVPLPACHRYLLHIDGNVASSRLASELHLGGTVFKQDSFSSEYFYPLLQPWTHYVPVSVDSKAR